MFIIITVSVNYIGVMTTMNDAFFIGLLFSLTCAFECVRTRLQSLKTKEGASHKEMEAELNDIVEDHVKCIE
jgi:hypothetical protein